ncbi:glycosyltransferase family 2 protein [Dolichospermum planctonicum UHCC 0167]|uniref:glycosyltransferase family 2 protein n=1 Tax=Dolichospermum planctonicum TaxID=136072 RepID=UPI0014433F50|nr:glycosyltransferase family 2 protein [Dolichospermum planctonicum]MCW9679335.1 glycosyltransferase family 2 protein [Dolichospermum planctonicum UHCC 0167]
MIHTNIANNPTLTVAIPAYNEVANIERIVREFLSTAYPNLIEVFVADGGSTDGTQDIVKNLALEDARVRLLHNPLKVQSAGLNLIIKECTGDIFLRADAHSDYAPDYIEKCVEKLLSSQSLNVGGAQRFVAKTAFQSGIAIASKSILGSGGAKYRDPNYNGYADTVYLGCFWKKALQEVSGYSIEATPNEDAELNQKLLQKNKNAIYISSEIRVWYYPRKTFKSLYIQYFKYGRGRYLTSIKHSVKSQIRGIVPFLVISLTTLLLLIDLLFPLLGLPIEILVIIGLLLPFLESLRVTFKLRNSFDSEIWRGDKGKIPSFLSRWFFCGIVLLTMPIAHSLGYAYQLLKHKILGLNGW